MRNHFSIALFLCVVHIKFQIFYFRKSANSIQFSRVHDNVPQAKNPASQDSPGEIYLLFSMGRSRKLCSPSYSMRVLRNASMAATRERVSSAPPVS